MAPGGPSSQPILIDIACGKTIKEACHEHGVHPIRYLLGRHRWPELNALHDAILELRYENDVRQIREMAEQVKTADYKEIHQLRLVIDTRKWIASRRFQGTAHKLPAVVINNNVGQKDDDMSLKDLLKASGGDERMTIDGCAEVVDNSANQGRPTKPRRET